jgi:hypothetical protein
MPLACSSCASDLDNIGQPIICAQFDLEQALLHENAVRMAREDRGSTSDDEDELEEATPLATSTNVSPPPAASDWRHQKETEKSTLPACQAQGYYPRISPEPHTACPYASTSGKGCSIRAHSP